MSGPPTTPQKCFLVNQTEISFLISCQPGYNGGLQQHLHMEVFSQPANILLAYKTRAMERIGMTGEEVLIGARGLTGAPTYKAIIYASNKRGKSQPVGLNTLQITQGKRGINQTFFGRLFKLFSKFNFCYLQLLVRACLSPWLRSLCW